MKKRFALLLTLAAILTGCTHNSVESISAAEKYDVSPPLTEQLGTTPCETTTEVTTTTPLSPTATVTTVLTTASSPLSEPVSAEERGELITIPSSNEIFNEFHRIMSQSQEGLSMDEIVTLLMCRNVIAFETGQLYPFEFISRPEVLDFSDGDPLICELSSEYYESSADITAMYEATYVAEEVQNRILRKGEPWFFDNEAGSICVDLQLNSGTWVTQPFSTSTEIQLCSYSDTYCEFVWHYSAVFYEDGEFSTSPREILCGAAKESGEWRLVMMVFDNPELSAEGMRELYE